MIRAGDLASLTATERHARHDELDDLITAYTSTCDGTDLMERLQAGGVAAHIVQNGPELSADPQLVHRGHFTRAPHAKQGEMVVDGPRFTLSRTPGRVDRAGPTFGEHTFEILTDMLGYDGDRIAELAVAELLE